MNNTIQICQKIYYDAQLGRCINKSKTIEKCGECPYQFKEGKRDNQVNKNKDKKNGTH